MQSELSVQPEPEREQQKTIWLTVKDFAAAANISTQRVYQLLNAPNKKKGIAKALQTYCKQENGSRYVSVEALSLFGNAKELQETYKPLANGIKASNYELIIDTPVSTVAKELQDDLQVEKSPTMAAEQAALSVLQEQIHELKAECTQLKSELRQAKEDTDKFRQDSAVLSERLRAAEERVVRAESALEAEKAQNQALTEQLAVIADKQADALRAGAAEQLALAVPSPEHGRGLFAKLFHRKSDKKT